LNGARRTSKPETAFSLILILSVLSFSAIPTLAQTRVRSLKGTSRQHLVTLETILSCANDSLITQVFNTDKSTAINLNAVLMVEMKYKKIRNDDYVELKSKGFVTRNIDDSSFGIMPTNALSGSLVPESDLAFCHDLPTAHYDRTGYKSGPRDVDIGGENWVFNPNEIFAHADQFHFDSGVFTNSADIFFTAKKGRVSIQFLCKGDGLRFYRAIYVPGD
jgi:hypothetical protein